MAYWLFGIIFGIFDAFSAFYRNRPKKSKTLRQYYDFSILREFCFSKISIFLKYVVQQIFWWKTEEARKRGRKIIKTFSRRSKNRKLGINNDFTKKSRIIPKLLKRHVGERRIPKVNRIFFKVENFFRKIKIIIFINLIK